MLLQSFDGFIMKDWFPLSRYILLKVNNNNNNNNNNIDDVDIKLENTQALVIICIRYTYLMFIYVTEVS
jgi:hypothetical protein